MLAFYCYSLRNFDPYIYWPYHKHVEKSYLNLLYFYKSQKSTFLINIWQGTRTWKSYKNEYIFNNNKWFSSSITISIFFSCWSFSFSVLSPIFSVLSSNLLSFSLFVWSTYYFLLTAGIPLNFFYGAQAFFSGMLDISGSVLSSILQVRVLDRRSVLYSIWDVFLNYILLYYCTNIILTYKCYIILITN